MLKELGAYLEKDQFTVSYVHHSKEVPVDRLVVILPIAYKEGLMLELFVSNTGKELEPYEILNYHINFQMKASTACLSDIKELILYIDQISLVNGFGIDIDDHTLFYRYRMLVNPADTVTPKLVTETIYLISFQLENFLRIIDKVNDGNLKIAEAKEKIRLKM
jgi:hypothetical protein